MVKPKHNNQDTINENRKPYIKPQIERVMLVPDEAVLAICKIGSDTGPGPVAGCINIGPCSDIVS